MRLYFLQLIVVAGLSSINSGANAGVTSYGVIGDSTADEYQFSVDRSGARSFVEQLAESRGLDFGAFTGDSRDEPRNRGFERNWASGGARTGDAQPQLQGLTDQIAGGSASRGLMFLGQNNFRDILSGADAEKTYRAGFTNTVAAVVSLLRVDPNFRLAIANIPDITRFPEARMALERNPFLTARHAQVSSLIDTYNDALAFQFARNPRVAIVDAHGLFDELIDGKPVGPLTLDATVPGVDPRHLFVDPGHPGTIAQSLLANAFIDAFNDKFDDDLSPLTQAEILRPIGVPLPAAVWAGLGMAPQAWLAIRRMAGATGESA